MKPLVRIAVALLAVVAAPLQAQPTWPHKPVRMVLSLGPGSGADIGARLYRNTYTIDYIASVGWRVSLDDVPNPNGESI